MKKKLRIIQWYFVFTYDWDDVDLGAETAHELKVKRLENFYFKKEEEGEHNRKSFWYSHFPIKGGGLKDKIVNNMGKNVFRFTLWLQKDLEPSTDVLTGRWSKDKHAPWNVQMLLLFIIKN